MKKKGYDLLTIEAVRSLLNEGTPIRKVARLKKIPETTIRNWKFNYVFNDNILTIERKRQVFELLRSGLSMPKIAQKVGLTYNCVRLYALMILSKEEYAKIKVLDKQLSNSSQLLSPELAYILGVMYGDGYFGIGQIKLGTKDKDFSDYFSQVVEQWCGKKPSQIEYTRYDRPYFDCYLSFKKAADFVREVVQERKKVPTIISTSKNLYILTMFIKGFSDSEGSITLVPKWNAAYIRMYNQKINLLNELRLFLINLGFKESKVKIVLNNKAINGPVYALRIGGRDQLELFNQKIGFTIQRKQQKLEEFLNRDKK